MKFDTLHFALLVAIVLLAVYVARGYGLFREGVQSCVGRCGKVSRGWDATGT
jgi:hypothetical protein